MNEIRTKLCAAFPAGLVLKSHGLVNPQSGLRGKFVAVQEDGKINVKRVEDGFELALDLEGAMLCSADARSKLTPPGVFPYPEIDQISCFFLSSEFISCKLPNGNVIELEGRMCLQSKEIRVDAVDTENHAWFWFVIGHNCLSYC